MKTRIKYRKFSNGEEQYFPQYKKFLFWKYFENIHEGGAYSYDRYCTLEEALQHLERYESSFNNKRVVEEYFIYKKEDL